MRQQDAFGTPGGARGIGDREGVRLCDRGRQHGTVGAGNCGFVFWADAQRGRTAVGERDTVGSDDKARAAIRKDHPQFISGKQRVERSNHDTAFAQACHDLRVFDAIWRDQRDDIALP